MPEGKARRLAPFHCSRPPSMEGRSRHPLGHPFQCLLPCSLLHLEKCLHRPGFRCLRVPPPVVLQGIMSRLAVHPSPAQGISMAGICSSGPVTLGCTAATPFALFPPVAGLLVGSTAGGLSTPGTMGPCWIQLVLGHEPRRRPQHTPRHRRRSLPPHAIPLEHLRVT